MLTSKWSSRKLWLAMFWQGVFTTLLVLGHIPIDPFLSLTWLLLGGYFVGNLLTQHMGLGAKRE
jgi:hypothetical protein